MNLEYKSLLPEDFADGSRVWIFQSGRLLSISEALQMEEMLDSFVRSWTSHGDKVAGFGSLFFGRFIVLMADESATGVSGCSTDSAIRLIKELEKHFNISLFDRNMLAFLVKDKVEILPLNQLKYAAENGFISADTFYFNNLVANKHELIHKWIVPVKDSWLASRLPTLKSA
jgi:hypothetical protein